MPFDQRLLVDILATKTRQLPELTTSWCPQREEHGYLFAPVFKPSTHRWSAVDVMARLNQPIGDHIPLRFYQNLTLKSLSRMFL